MTAVQIISLSLFFIVLYSYRIKGSDVLSPARVFIIVWSIVLFLVEFKFSKLQTEWSLFSWFVLITGLLSFLLGLYIAYAMNISEKLLSINEIREKISTGNYNKDYFFIALTVLFIGYAVSLIAEFFIMGYIPAFHPNPDLARTEFTVFGLHILVNQMPVILLFSIEYFILKSGSKKKNRLALFYFAFTFISYFLLIIRFNYIYTLIMILALSYYATRIINIKRVTYIVGGLISLFYLLMSIRFSRYAAQFLHIVSKMKYPSKYAAFSGFYMYIVMNIENMARAADRIENHTYSYMTFDWLYAITGIKHWIKDYFNIDTRPFILSGYNTFPFLMEYYYDFGIAGVFFFPLISGIVIGMIYYKLRTRGTIDYAVYYGFCLFLIIIFFFTNPLTMLNIVANILVLWFVHKYILFSGTSGQKLISVRADG